MGPQGGALGVKPSRRSVSSNLLFKLNTKNTNEEQAPFVADFTSKDARVSMGLPASSSVDQNGFPIAKEDEELSSPSSDPSVRICTWCRRGGKDDIKFAKKLKLCSACQTTYYCR